MAGAWDVHFHCGPDVVPRSQNGREIAADAVAAGMAALCLKDHCGATFGAAAALDAHEGSALRVFGSLTLNPPAGGINPYAVEAALRAGARMVWFPTYSAKRHLEVLGRSPFPMPADSAGLTILDAGGTVLPEVEAVLKLVAEHDAIIGTGHLYPDESIQLFKRAKDLGVKRMVLTHATLNVTAADVALQKEARAIGAYIEHCMLALTPACRSLSEAEMVATIQATGAERVFLTSDLGSKDNGPVVAGFANWVLKLVDAGLDFADARRMITETPESLFS